ncbi:unnamed protein product [Heterobilharzia americana]|nr:unnamed protein product [Heterobilharzia americana]
MVHSSYFYQFTIQCDVYSSPRLCSCPHIRLGWLHLSRQLLNDSNDGGYDISCTNRSVDHWIPTRWINTNMVTMKPEGSEFNPWLREVVIHTAELFRTRTKQLFGAPKFPVVLQLI